MQIILVPGFWLTADSWAAVTPGLKAAGHRVRALTLPGLDSVDSPRAGIGLRDHIDAVVAAIDEAAAPVVLVGHSGGGAIIHGALDARPDRVVHAVYVDSAPLGEGASINDALVAVGDEIPLPDWDGFEPDDLVDLTDDLRERFRADAVPQPRGVATDPMHLHDERRFAVPATVVACEFPSALIVEWVGSGQPFVAELARMRSVSYVDLPTGHWPQFTKPAELAAVILDAVDRAAGSGM
ncbi:MAG: alpha/beta hydrolase [Cryobacterium sp.]